jgi:hypothetical protein
MSAITYDNLVSILIKPGYYKQHNPADRRQKPHDLIKEKIINYQQVIYYKILTHLEKYKNKQMLYA